MVRFNIFNIGGDRSVLEPGKKNEEASSELIGSIILIGLFVAVFGILLMTITSSTSDFIVPAVVIEPQPITSPSGWYVLDLRAGDTLLRNATRIIVDGVDKTGEFMEGPFSDPGAFGWQQWGSGDSLYLEYPSSSPPPNTVQIIYYNPEGDGILLWELGSTENRLPVANFSAKPLSGTSPLSVQFTDDSLNNPTSWLWEFGDGGTSSLQHPERTYTSPGVYTVRLTVTNLYGTDPLVKTEYIRVSEEFIVDFTATPLSGTSPLTATFTDLTTGTPTSWTWTFGDGTTSTEQHPTHTYSSGGSYAVTLIASNGILTETEQKLAYINVTDPCLPGLFGTYYDKFNDKYGVPFSGNPSYRIDPRIWFADTESKKESDEINWPVATVGKDNTFSVLYEGFLIVPENSTYTFYLESDDGSVLWIDNVRDTDPVVIDNWGSDGKHPAIEKSVSLYLTKGKHPIRIKMTEYYGGAVFHLKWKSSTIPLEVVESFCHLPGGFIGVEFKGTPLSGATPLEVQFTDLSMGDISAWEWHFGDGTTSTDQNPVHTYLSPGSYTVTLAVSNGISSYSKEKSDYVYVTDGCLPGLYGTYFDESNLLKSYHAPFSGNTATRVDSRIWFADKYSKKESDVPNWPVATVGKDNTFSVMYEGYLIVPKDDTYTFHLRSDDGSVLWIDNVLDTDPVVIDNGWWLAWDTTTSAKIQLTQGKHPIRIKMRESTLGAILHLEWESATIPRQPVESFCHGSVSSLIAEFNGTPRSGEAPLFVQFTDLSTGGATSWNWNFGDGTTSSAMNPLHTYAAAGTYDVNLTVMNAHGTDAHGRTAYITVAEGVSAFADYIVNENVFVYGQELSFAGGSVKGPGATIHITGDSLNTDDFNPGASIAVSNIYVDGSINLDGGSADLGSQRSPGSIYVTGDFTLGAGARDIYGDVYINGNCFLKDPIMHGNVYVNGDLKLDWTPNLNDADVYYTGTFTHPPSMGSSILNKCVKNATVPGFVIPDYAMPSVKNDDWYSSRGYASGGALVSNMKIFADSYSSSGWLPSATNVIIVAKNGDITLTGLGGSGVTGVLFAPKGKVVFNGGSFEGLVIAKEGFEVTSGGTAVTFKNMNEYISNPADYPF